MTIQHSDPSATPGPTSGETPGEDAAEVEQAPDQWLRSLVEWVVVIVGAVALAMVIRVFLLQSFYIPSGSMEHTLEVNDRVMVNKLSYQWSEPSQGDIVVFERPPSVESEYADLIKRVIALPGDVVEGRDNQVLVNGQALSEPYLDPAEFTSDFEATTVPAGHVWVMGDNRSHSRDNREFGPIPTDSIVGRSMFIYWPLGRLGGT